MISYTVKKCTSTQTCEMTARLRLAVISQVCAEVPLSRLVRKYTIFKRFYLASNSTFSSFSFSSPSDHEDRNKRENDKDPMKRENENDCYNKYKYAI